MKLDARLRVTLAVLDRAAARIKRRVDHHSTLRQPKARDGDAVEQMKQLLSSISSTQRKLREPKQLEISL